MVLLLTYEYPVASYTLAWVEMTYSLRMNCSTSVANYMLA